MATAKKSYKVTHKFCNVTVYVEAESEEEAYDKADPHTLQAETQCYASDCQELKGVWVEKEKRMCDEVVE